MKLNLFYSRAPKYCKFTVALVWPLYGPCEALVRPLCGPCAALALISQRSASVTQGRVSDSESENERVKVRVSAKVRVNAEHATRSSCAGLRRGAGFGENRTGPVSAHGLHHQCVRHASKHRYVYLRRSAS